MTNVNFVNVCKFTAASAGTGSFVVSAAVTGYQTPLTAGASSFNYRYRAESADLTQWEVGTGAYTPGTVTLTRTPSINSVGGSSAINFTTAPQVGLVFSADDIQATGQLLGSDGATSASAGNVGEFVTATVFSTTPVTSGGSGVNTTVTSISISSGDWDVRAFMGILPSSGLSTFFGTISSAGATLPADLAYLTALQSSQSFLPATRMAFPQATRRWITSASTTVYLVGLATHTASAVYYGSIEARRMR